MVLRIKLLRMEREFTQWEIARASAISQGRYSMIERGLIAPTADERHRLATMFDTAPATLLCAARRRRPIKEVGQ